MSDHTLKTRFLTGVAVLVPLAVSMWVLLTLVNFVGGVLSPISGVLRANGIESGTVLLIIQLLSIIVISVLVLGIGTVAQRQVGQNVIDALDEYISRIPGLGSIYTTTRQMSDLVLDPNGDGTKFREVKLVEFPADETYTLGFLTSDSPPESVVTAARTIMAENADFQTVFLPMAPNPVMGGHLAHIPEHRVHDVDMTVEQAVQYILTTGIVSGGDGVELDGDSIELDEENGLDES